jgi:hypothetical protein
LPQSGEFAEPDLLLRARFADTVTLRSASVASSDALPESNHAPAKRP